jgi:hypothetical protein
MPPLPFLLFCLVRQHYRLPPNAFLPSRLFTLPPNAYRLFTLLPRAAALPPNAYRLMPNAYRLPPTA